MNIQYETANHYISFPYPINKGDKLRAYYQIKELSKQFEIHLISISDQKIYNEDYRELEFYCKTIKVLYLPVWKKRFVFA